MGRLSDCTICKYYLSTKICSAFPDGIPEEILNGKVSHEEPYPGDNGYQFIPIEGMSDDDPLFEEDPIGDMSKEEFDALLEKGLVRMTTKGWMKRDEYIKIECREDLENSTR